MRRKHVVLYKDKSNQFRYKVVAANSRVVGVSEEGFKRRDTVVKRLRQTYPDLPIRFLYGTTDEWIEAP